ncbi:MAG: helix-turn-helix transcriptional regulator [Mucilaginibacter sp.]|uniref:helix-turn-helix domain-containing protein n=1 Tax=Mucilaginibacter sp. TaxID=1882438 RepID=UPI0032648F94
MKDETFLFRIKFGLRIKELRIQRKIEQAVLASELNKDKQFINRYENEGANPRADIIQDIAKALKLDKIDELFDFKSLNESEIQKIYAKIKKS